MGMCVLWGWLIAWGEQGSGVGVGGVGGGRMRVEVVGHYCQWVGNTNGKVRERGLGVWS